jgi:hypothetical protein
MLSIMLFILLSIGDPRNVTYWTCAKRLEAVFIDVCASIRFAGNDL